MAAFSRYEDIVAWQKGRELVLAVYRISSIGEMARDFGFRDQIRRAAVSVCANIAEGFERRGNRDFVKFLWISKGSAAEVSSLLHHASDLGYITAEEFDELYGAAKLVSAAVYNLIKSIVDSEHSIDYVKQERKHPHRT